jgi:hypothetical protein
MKKIIGLIFLIAVMWIGYHVYVTKFGVPTDPVVAYQKISGMPITDQAKAVQGTLAAWIHDPSSLVPYPKGWRKVSITIRKETFDVITPDPANPPQYYVSTAFPKNLMKKVTIARCLNLDPKKITDWCVVGDNPQVTAYFNIIQWVKDNSSFNGQSLMQGIMPTMNIN